MEGCFSLFKILRIVKIYLQKVLGTHQSVSFEDKGKRGKRMPCSACTDTTLGYG